MKHNRKEPRRRAAPPAVQRALRGLGENIGGWRRLRGLTQAQLADRANLSRTTIVRLEAGDGGIGTENLLRALRGLGLLDTFDVALDPFESDVGRLRAGERLPDRVRPRDLGGGGGDG